MVSGSFMGPDPRSMGAQNLVCPYHRGSLRPCPGVQWGETEKIPRIFLCTQGGAELPKHKRLDLFHAIE